MSEAPVIRQATMGDAAELARLRWDFSPDEVAAGGQPFDAFAAGFAAFLDEALAGGAWAIWVAADEGRLLGNLYLQTIAKSSPAGRLRPALRVHHQRLRRAGVARPGSGDRLLRHAIASARDRRLEFLILWPSEESPGFYARAGFRPAGEAMTLSLQP